MPPSAGRQKHRSPSVAVLFQREPSFVDLGYISGKAKYSALADDAPGRQNLL